MPGFTEKVAFLLREDVERVNFGVGESLRASTRGTVGFGVNARPWPERCDPSFERQKTQMMTQRDMKTGLNARTTFVRLHSFALGSAVEAWAWACVWACVWSCVWASIAAGSSSLSAADGSSKKVTRATGVNIESAKSAAASSLTPAVRTRATTSKDEDADPGTPPTVKEVDDRSEPISVTLREPADSFKLSRPIELSPENAEEKISSIVSKTDDRFEAGTGSPEGRLPVVLNSLVKEFRTASDDYVATQKELTRKLRGASVEEKARLREALQANKEKFSHSTAPLREQLHDRLEDLKRDLKEHGQAISAGAGGGGGRRRGGD